MFSVLSIIYIFTKVFSVLEKGWWAVEMSGRHGDWTMEVMFLCLKTYTHPLNNIWTPTSPRSNTHTTALMYIYGCPWGTNAQQSPISALYSNLSVFPPILWAWIVSTLKTTYFPRCKAKKLKIIRKVKGIHKVKTHGCSGKYSYK